MMKNTGSKTVDGTVPRAGSNRFAAIFLKRGSAGNVPTTKATAAERVEPAHATSALDPGSSMPATPLHAAARHPGR